MKLHSNSDARRAIVSQIITYAAFLQGFSIAKLERGPPRKSLAEAEHDSIFAAVNAQDQEGAVDADSFKDSLQDHLRAGSFRLVLVLDEVPSELERVVAYLDAVTVSVTIDLIEIRDYEVNGARFVVPRRVSLDIGASVPPGGSRHVASRKNHPKSTEASDVFRDSLEDATGEACEKFDRLIAWAEELASLPNVRLFNGIGLQYPSLLPCIMTGPNKACLAYIWF